MIIPTWEPLQELIISRSTNHDAIVGIDEVGRGAWAGPVVAAAVILPWDTTIAGLRDSKFTSQAQRQRLNLAVYERALAVGIGWVSAAEVDQHGLSWAVRSSGLRALDQAMRSVATAPQLIVLDGTHNYLADDARAVAIVKADATIVPVAAASIIAKQARDEYMQQLDTALPGYEFGRHVGYGTVAHQAALHHLGATQEHRLSFKPLRQFSATLKPA